MTEITDCTTHDGLIVRKEGKLNRCAGFLFHFGEKGAFDPDGSVTVGGRHLTPEEVARHNAILAEAELKATITSGKGLFYLTGTGPTVAVGNWTGSWKAPWREVRTTRHGTGEARLVWFTGPDGKRWHGINKGDNQLLRARRVKGPTNA